MNSETLRPNTRLRQAAMVACLMLTFSLEVRASAATPTPVSTPVPAKPTVKTKAKPIAQTYFICKLCGVYYTASEAKKIHYKDPMGHTLTRTNKIPKGFQDGSKIGGSMKM